MKNNIPVLDWEMREAVDFYGYPRELNWKRVSRPVGRKRKTKQFFRGAQFTPYGVVIFIIGYCLTAKEIKQQYLDGLDQDLEYIYHHSFNDLNTTKHN